MRTDLAIEAAQQLSLKSDLEGISQNIEIYENLSLEVTDISVETQAAAEKLSKPMGRYITVRSLDGTFDKYSECFEQRVEIIAKQINLLHQNAQNVLCAGLGNREITPDAVGPLCTDKIFATRHIKALATEIDTGDLLCVSAISTGVMGQTGIEASEQVKAVCDRISPDLVVAVDALACADIEHLGCTIQLCNTGISPGSGVANARSELSENTLGVCCIAVGIPTVVDLSVAAQQLSGSPAKKEIDEMMVTSRNCDKLVFNAANYISCAINRAFQPSISLDDLRSLTQ